MALAPRQTWTVLRCCTAPSILSVDGKCHGRSPERNPMAKMKKTTMTIALTAVFLCTGVLSSQLAAQQKAAISGRVRSANGDPLGGIEVSVYGAAVKAISGQEAGRMVA